MIPLDWKPDERQLKLFRGIWFPLLILMVTYWIERFTDHWITPLAIGAVILLGCFCSIGFTRILYIGLMILAAPIGLVISFLILLAIFYLVITPIGLLLRAFGHDPLMLRKSSAMTFWTPHRAPENKLRYFKQY